MALNLYVSYDLDNAPPERYEAVRDAIQRCGKYAWLQYSFCYLKTDLTLNVVHDRIRMAMRDKDRLAVFHAINAIVSPLANDLAATLRQEFQTA